MTVYEALFKPSFKLFSLYMLESIYSKKPWVHISVHKRVRELDAKLLLSLHLLRQNFNVTIGRSAAVINSAELLPRGIYCDLRFLATREKHFKRFIDNSHKIVAFDEEATSFSDKTDYQSNHVSLDTIKLCNLCFCWGQYHTDCIKEKLPQNSHDKIVNSGHPRFDMLREVGRLYYAPQIKSILNKFGSFFLLTSNTGGWILNRELESKWISYVQRNIIEEKEANKKYFSEKFEYRTKRHNHLSHAAELLAQSFPDYTLVIRPHFTETAQHWKNSLTKNYPNIKIIHEASSIPWIMASKAVIHSSCTSGTEAFLAGANPIAFRPIKNELFDAKLPNSLSLEADSSESLIEMLSKIQNGSSIFTESEMDERTKLAEYYYSSRTGKLASERVAEKLAEISFIDSNNHQKAISLINKFKSRKISDSVIRGSKTIYRNIRKRLNFSNENISQENAITLYDIQVKMKAFSEIYRANFDKPIHVKQIGEQLFMITAG
jgi:surface carbohydrate biosynthesis protein